MELRWYGAARFVDPHTVEITGDGVAPRRVSGRAMVIAVGSVPHRPDHIPFDGKYVIDSDGMVCLEHIPRSLVVIGGA